MSVKMSSLPFLLERWKREVKIFFVVFYLVGLVGLLVPTWFPLFLQLVPLALILSFVGLLLFHSPKRNRTSLFVFAGMYLLGFFIEVIGVHSGVIFGAYHYGDTLGVKLFQTPLLIGVNWIFLSYTAVSMVQTRTDKTTLHLLIAPLVMVCYDLVLEQVAPLMKMWFWAQNEVPLQNYIAWWIIGVLFVALFKLFRIETKNSMALVLFLCQYLFFVLLFFGLKGRL